MINSLNPAILESQMGLLAYPLFICAIISLVIIIERFLILGVKTLSDQLGQKGQHIIKLNRLAPKVIREEIASVWLRNQQTKLAFGIKPLHIITLLAPLLGLLGTIIGLIEVFDTLGTHAGPIEPNLLANGLGIAMKTTAAGLMIAVPSLLAAHVYQLWVDRLVQHLEKQMNMTNLLIEGVSTEALA